MIIGVEVATARAGMTGVGSYARHLSDALTRVEGLRVRLYTPQPTSAQLTPAAARQLASAGSWPSRVAWLHLGLPWLAARDGLDLLHATNFIAPLLSPCPTVITVHDLGSRTHPQSVPWAKRLYHRVFLGPAARRAAAVIAVSEATRADVVRYLGVAPERVFVVPEAADPQFRPVAPAEIARVRARHQLSEPYVLAVGFAQPRKNLPNLLRAWRSFQSQTTAAPHDLVLVGPGDPGRLPPRVHALGYVAAEDLPALYAGATACAVVSHFEGFGLPAVEAMATGCPVIASHGSALDEVVGDAALRVQPDSPDSIAQALASVQDSAHQEELRRRGLSRARRYSWEEAGRATAQVYRTALNLDGQRFPEISRPPGCPALEWAILRTVCYADVFDSPLRTEELWRALQGYRANLAEVESAVENSAILATHLERTGELLHFAGRRGIVEIRARREAAAERFMARQERALRVAASIPFLRMMAFSGGTAHRTSLSRDDVDLFVLTRSRRAWSTLAAMIIATKALGVRSDVCANYLLDEDHLKVDLQHDVYTAHQLIHLWPVLGEVTYRRFYQENAWVAEHFPNAGPRSLAPEGQSLVPHRAGRWAEALLALGGDGTEWVARLVTTLYLRLRHRGKMGNAWLGPGTVKLHMKDHRGPTLERFHDRLSRVAATFSAESLERKVF